jgi:hypothetical protein
MKNVLRAALLLVIAQGALAADEWNFTRATARSTFRIDGASIIPGKQVMGTCFIVGRPFASDPKRLRYVLVTAAHVLSDLQGESATLHLRRLTDGRYERMPIPLRIRSGSTTLWIQHATADVAIMPLAIPKEADIVLISSDFFASDEKIDSLEITIGDELNVLGFPFGVEANSAGIPVLRSGKIASFPLTPTRVTGHFLLDFEVFPGNSGGPVLLEASMRRGASGTGLGHYMVLLGVVSRERDLKEQLSGIDEVTVRTHRLGLAEIVHASFIRELLDTIPPD